MYNMQQNQQTRPQNNPQYVQYVMQQTGSSIEQCAADVANAGLGDYHTIVARLREGDVTVLMDYANWVRQNNTQAWNQATQACQGLFGRR
jgi:hypothetical protein